MPVPQTPLTTRGAASGGAKMDAMASAEPVRFTVATYNIHKGFSQLTRRMVIHELRERLHGLAADILFLQEVLHTHDRHATRYRDWPGKPQHEFIADAIWHEVAYGRNAVYPHGHHGNAVLSRFPMLDAGEPATSRRTCSKAAACCIARSRSATGMPSLHCINVHLGLFERGRQWQIRTLVERIRAQVPDDAPLIIAGDFNDWRSKGDRTLTDALGCVEVFEDVTGRPARTFPSLMPVFRLDRIYARGLRVVDARVHYATPGARMSDHAALAATFEVASPKRRR